MNIYCKFSAECSSESILEISQQLARTNTRIYIIYDEDMDKSLRGCFLTHSVCSVSQKIPPLRTCGNFSETDGNFSTKFDVPITRSCLR